MNMLFITREKDSPVECYNDDGTISMIIDGVENNAMRTGGLDPSLDQDVFEYVNHLQHGHYDDFAGASKEDVQKVYQFRGEDGGRFCLAAVMHYESREESDVLDGHELLPALRVGESARLTGGVGVYYDAERIY